MTVHRGLNNGSGTSGILAALAEVSVPSFQTPPAGGVTGGACASRVFEWCKSEHGSRVPSWTALKSREWKATKEKIRLCGQLENPIWVGGRDKLGILDPWMQPGNCDSRFCDECAKSDIRDAMLGLDYERQAAHERQLAVVTLAVKSCRHKVCRDYAWLHFAGWAAKWRDAMRYDEAFAPAGASTRSGRKVAHVASPRFVQALEQHVSGFPHGHALMRMLPPETRVVEIERKGKMVRREIACGGFLRRARRRWHAITRSWTVFYEVLQSNPFYFAKYVDEAYRLPEDIKALLRVHGKRMWSKSNDIPMPPKLDSRWIITRHRPSVVMERVGLTSRPI